MGDGEIPLFIYASVDASGNVKAMTCSQDPPWHGFNPVPDEYDRQGRQYKYVPQLSSELVAMKSRADENMKGGGKPSTEDLALMKTYASAIKEAPTERVEITPAMKNEAMGKCPSTIDIMSESAKGNSIILLDPVADITEEMRVLFTSGEATPTDLLIGGYLNITNNSLIRSTPPGIDAFAFNWK